MSIALRRGGPLCPPAVTMFGCVYILLRMMFISGLHQDTHEDFTFTIGCGFWALVDSGL